MWRCLSGALARMDMSFVNAGINGQLAYNLLRRLDDIVACRPDVVTILIGTNDVNATFSQAWEDTYRKEQKLPEKPTLAWYRLNVERIIAGCKLRPTLKSPAGTAHAG